MHMFVYIGGEVGGGHLWASLITNEYARCAKGLKEPLVMEEPAPCPATRGGLPRYFR